MSHLAYVFWRQGKFKSEIVVQNENQNHEHRHPIDWAKTIPLDRQKSGNNAQTLWRAADGQ